MPSQPAWFHRLDEILADLRSMTSTHLDRAAVEKLFRVRQRRARQIMAGLEGLRVGNAAADVRERRLGDLSGMAATVVNPSGVAFRSEKETLDPTLPQSVGEEHALMPGFPCGNMRRPPDIVAGESNCAPYAPSQLRTLFALSVYNGADSRRSATKIVPWD